MKILILGDAPSSHIIKWSNSLSDLGYEITIFSLLNCDQSLYRRNVKVITSEVSVKLKYLSPGNILKFLYIKVLPTIKKLIREEKPDILHSHFASSYGLLGALTNFHPFILSIWGSDVFSFPRKSFFHRKIFKFNLKKADRLLSTSEVMAREILNYTNRDITVTPFGIDTEIFKPGEKINIFNGEVDFVVGTIKGLEEIYGIEYLIEAYCQVKQNLPKLSIKLVIVGTGSLEDKLRSLVKTKNLESDVLITGKVSYSEVQKYHNLLDIYLALSIYDDESFGVAILEASACEKPVIVSNVGGLPEVVVENVTGFIIPPKNSESAAEKMLELINNSELRKKFGIAGRKRVIEHYSWNICLQKMIDVYKSV
jgi:glycosyltransferase involved in cell wall biosynthesis